MPWSTPIRYFSTGLVARNLSRYPSFVHKALKDVPYSKETQNLPKARKRILILSPEQTKDKKYNKYVQEVNRKGRRQTPRQMLKLLEDDAIKIKPPTSTKESLMESIELFKPSSADISIGKKAAIVSDICKGFKALQLQEYILKKHGSLKGLKAGTKQKLASFILEKIWTTNVKEMSLDDLLVTESVPLTRYEMFLLLLSHGLILRHIRSAVSKIEFDSESKKLLLTGTPDQVENAKINLTSDLEGAHMEEIDLSVVKKLALKQHGHFNVAEVGSNTEVYFDPLKNDKYELYALNKNQLKRTKRLLLWLLNYNLHTKEFLHLPEGPHHFLPFKQDDLLAWKDRSKDLYVLEKKDQKPSQLLLDELAKFSDESLSKIDLYDETWRDEDNKLSLKAAAEKQSDSKGWDLLESLGFGSESNETTQPQTSEQMSHVTISKEQRDQLYKELTDFKYKLSLPGVAADNLDPKLFTVTLGNVLFEIPTNKKNIVPSATLEQKHKLVLFNSNVMLAHDKIISMRANDSSSPSYRDPHMYSLQFKFTPSPFVASLETDKAMEYPPVEMWVQLKANLMPDVDTLQIVSVEGENSSLVCLPDAKSDIKISCQMTGRILEEQEDADFEDQSISQTLDSTIDRYLRFSSQPGVVDFLEKSTLDYSGRAPTSIAPTIDLVINGKTVRYHYLNVSYRREIAVELPQEDGTEQMVHVSVVEGGSLGGKRIEIRFVGDYAAETSREEFDELLDRVLGFINTL